MGAQGLNEKLAHSMLPENVKYEIIIYKNGRYCLIVVMHLYLKICFKTYVESYIGLKIEYLSHSIDVKLSSLK